MFFETYILESYNKNVGSTLLIDCPCYLRYITAESFENAIIEKRGSYMGCLKYDANVRCRTNHCSVPIMLGSDIDVRIRGLQAVIECRGQWGLVILRGLLKIYDNFSTFDALSMHVHQTKNNKSIDWFTYVDEDGLALSYSNKVVTCTYKHETFDNTNAKKSERWIELLTASNPFGTTVCASEYLQMFDTILAHDYSMNDLKIRQIINGPKIIRKYIASDLNRRKRKKLSGNQKMSVAFETGALFQVLSKKNTFHTDEWHKNYPQNYDNTMHDGRSNKTAHFLPNIARASNAAVRNSNALSFPTDAVYYYCMLNTKDLKSAGEQNVLADYVIMTEETDQLALYRYLKALYNPTIEMTKKNKNNCNNINELITINNDGLNILTINGYLIHCRCQWTLAELIKIKRAFPHVTTQYSLPYIRFSTRDCIPIKYSDEYNVFFSPAETVHFKIVFPESDLLSITAKELKLDSLRKTPPAKSTVSINNIKGSIAKVTSPLHKKLMENSLGITCYMDMSQEEIENLIEYAVISTGHDTTQFEQAYTILQKEFKIKENQQQMPKQTNRVKAMKALYAMYPENRCIRESFKPPPPPSPQQQQQQISAIIMTSNANSNNTSSVNVNGNETITDYTTNTITSNSNNNNNNNNNNNGNCLSAASKINILQAKKEQLNEYLSVVYNQKYFDPPNIWNLRLRAAFGNPFGGCIEDGVVIDSTILPHIKPIYYNACFTIEFTFKTMKHPNDGMFIPINEDKGALVNETLIGCLISEHPAFVKCSKHSEVVTSKLGNQYYYLIHFLPKKTSMYQNLSVRHIRNNNIITIVIKGQNKAAFGVGSKIANAFGQKNIISMATDELREKCWGITRTGRKVHAQIVYSDVSLIGRLLSGQMYDMFTSDELALGPDNTIIAPVDLIIHTLHPFTNIKVFDIKVDTLTNINGFDSQNLCSVSSYLRNERVDAKVIQVLGLHGYDVNTKLNPRDQPIILKLTDDDDNDDEISYSTKNLTDVHVTATTTTTTITNTTDDDDDDNCNFNEEKRLKRK